MRAQVLCSICGQLVKVLKNGHIQCRRCGIYSTKISTRVVEGTPSDREVSDESTAKRGSKCPA